MDHSKLLFPSNVNFQGEIVGEMGPRPVLLMSVKLFLIFVACEVFESLQNLLLSSFKPDLWWQMVSFSYNKLM